MAIKILEEGERFLDHASGKEVIYKSTLENYYHYIVIGILNKGRIKFGWAKKNRISNISVKQYSVEKQAFTRSFMALSINIFPVGTCCWNNIEGYYVFCPDINYIKEIELMNNYGKGSNLYPYSFERYYDASHNMDLFTSEAPQFQQKFDPKITNLVPYTFGLEFETSAGAIPENECFKLGLIPLRDGSISGNEYSTTVLNTKENGFEKIQQQVSALKKYTNFDKECSLHIHFGGVGVSTKNILALYNICYYLQNDLSKFIPAYSFHTAKYKRSGKDYCKALPEPYSDFNQIFKFLGGGSYLGTLSYPHPRDTNRSAKWNINSRYYWVNFINMCFYSFPKTVEFRILRPTNNFHKIINWIYIFSAILKYADKIIKKPNITCNADIFKELRDSPIRTLREVFEQVYPVEICVKLNQFLKDCKHVCEWQSKLKDLTGEITVYEDKCIKTSVLESGL